MNRSFVLLVGLAAPACSGCFTARPSGPDEFYNHAARNLTEKPIAHHDEKSFLRMVRKRADAAFVEVCGTAGHSHAYADGFREGYVDYVEAGGTGEPPYLPPFRYRLTKYRTDGRVAAADDWYAGFRHGAAVARTSGLRELNYVPLPGPPVLASARTADIPPAAVFNLAHPDLLPVPRPVTSTPVMPVPAMPPRSVPPVLGANRAPATLPPISTFAAPTPAPATASAPQTQPAWQPVPVAAKPTKAMPKPVVLVEHTEPAAPLPAISADFTPWKAVLKPPGPTVTRDP